MAYKSDSIISMSIDTGSYGLPKSSDNLFMTLAEKTEDSFIQTYRLEVNWHSCREILSSIISCLYGNEDTYNIYGHTPTSVTRDISKICILFRLYTSDYQGKVADDRLIKNLHLLNPYEEALGVKESVLHEVTNISLKTNVNNDEEKIYLLELDPKWLSSPLLVSLYLLLFRSLKNINYDFYKSINDYSKKLGEDTYLGNLNNIDLINLLENIDEVLGNNPLTGLCDAKVDFSDFVYDEDEEYVSNNSDFNVKVEFVDNSSTSLRFKWREMGTCSGIGSFANRLDIMSRPKNEGMNMGTLVHLADNCSDVECGIGAIWPLNYFNLIKSQGK